MSNKSISLGQGQKSYLQKPVNVSEEIKDNESWSGTELTSTVADWSTGHLIMSSINLMAKAGCNDDYYTNVLVAIDLSGLMISNHSNMKLHWCVG